MRQLFKRVSGREPLVMTRPVLTQHVAHGQEWIVSGNRWHVDEVRMTTSSGETLPVPVNRAGIRAQQSCRAEEESRLPAALVSDYGNDLAHFHIQIDAA